MIYLNKCQASRSLVTLNSARLRLVTLFCPVYRNPTQLRHDFFLPIIHGLIRPTAYTHIFKILVHFTCQSRLETRQSFWIPVNW